MVFPQCIWTSNLLDPARQLDATKRIISPASLSIMIALNFQVFSIITMICSLIACCSPAGWLRFVSISALILCLLFYAIHLFRMHERMLAPCIMPAIIGVSISSLGGLIWTPLVVVVPCVTQYTFTSLRSWTPAAMHSCTLWEILREIDKWLEYFMEFGSSFSKLKIMRTAITYSTKKCGDQWLLFP